ncbi:MAG: YbaB/EbfC family nucleoid-associated protein [Alphaproteobacteria bacterium]|nr:YbaB/EbfC family nucleoid-associated protein [Alphaproteobacteria bacterium]
MINFKDMMAQAQQMQFKMQEMQAKFEDIEVSGESGGGMVKVVMTCTGVVKSVDIDPSVMSEKDVLEDLVVAAVNNAGDAKESRVKEETDAMVKALGLPADAKLPF